MLTTYDLDRHVYDALAAGAAGFLLKATPPDRLVRDLGGELVSTELVPGGTETVTFNHSGDYEYYCSIHDGMSGRILVES